jgi:hypothetical protein
MNTNGTSPNHQFINIQQAVADSKQKKAYVGEGPQVLAVGQKIGGGYMNTESPDQVIMVNTESPIMQMNNIGRNSIEDSRKLNSRRQFQIRNTSTS